MQSITLDATIESIRPLTDFIDELLEACNCPMKTQMQIDVAIDEIFSNIANYAYNGSKGTATVTAGYDEQKKQFEITFADRGEPYDPLDKEDPDITLSADERGIGGLGIYLVKKTMDSLTYQHDNGQNVLTVTKKF